MQCAGFSRAEIVVVDRGTILSSGLRHRNVFAEVNIVAFTQRRGLWSWLTDKPIYIIIQEESLQAVVERVGVERLYEIFKVIVSHEIAHHIFESTIYHNLYFGLIRNLSVEERERRVDRIAYNLRHECTT